MPVMETQHAIAPEMLETYIKTRVLPALGGQHRPFMLELVKSGSRNIIWILTLAGGGKFVLKAVSKRFRIKNIIRAHVYLERRGIPVPRLLFADRAWKTAGTLGYYFACEEHVEGSPLDALGGSRSSHITSIASLFAGMHATESFRWGKLKTFQILGFRDYFLRKAAERSQAIAAAGAMPRGDSADSLMTWFERKKSVIRPIGRFSLCHGDVNTKNILVSPEGKIHLIDTEAFKFLPFQIEYFRLSYALCGFDAPAHERFKSAYGEIAPRKNLQRLESGGYLYHAYVLLEIAWYFNKKLKQEGLTPAEHDDFAANRAAAVARLAAIMENNR